MGTLVPGRVTIGMVGVSVHYTMWWVSMCSHMAQNLFEGLRNVDPHIGSDELHRQCYDVLQPRWHEWSGGYHVPIKKTTLRGVKVHAAIAGKDLIGPARERDAILDYFMKPDAKTGELVFRPAQIELALVIEYEVFLLVSNEKEGIYEPDNNSISICRNVKVQGP